MANKEIVKQAGKISIKTLLGQDFNWLDLVAKQLCSITNEEYIVNQKSSITTENLYLQICVKTEEGEPIDISSITTLEISSYVDDFVIKSWDLSDVIVVDAVNGLILIKFDDSPVVSITDVTIEMIVNGNLELEIDLKDV